MAVAAADSSSDETNVGHEMNPFPSVEMDVHLAVLQMHGLISLKEAKRCLLKLYIRALHNRVSVFTPLFLDCRYLAHTITSGGWLGMARRRSASTAHALWVGEGRVEGGG